MRLSFRRKFGKAFPDEIAKVSFSFKHFDKKGGGGAWQEGLISGLSDVYQSPQVSNWRKLTFILLLIFVFSALFFRLFHLQVVEGKSNRELADSNRIQVRVIHAPRGVIYDRNGKILAQNEPGFRLYESIGSAKKTRLISREEALKMEVDDDPRFANLEIDSVRSYSSKEKTSHILGYVAEVTEEELKNPNFKNYTLGDRTGRGGVEQVYEKVLKGVDGGEVVEVDAQGKKIRTLRRSDPIPGQNLYLTIDIDLQNTAYDKLKEGIEKIAKDSKRQNTCCGTVIAQDPQTGQILALVSYPSFDPMKLEEALTASNFPMLNRAIGGTYPPGSTFKMISILAGFESGKIKKDTKFVDQGFVNLGPFKFTNWYFTQYGRTEGIVDPVIALKRSNDTFFYYLAQLTTEKPISEMARHLSFGKELGIDIPGEQTGLVPDNAWKVKNTGEVWYPGDSLHFSIGQGFLLTTPLQILHLTSTIASDGKQYPPHLALKITSPEGETIKEYNYDPSSSKQLNKEALGVVKQGLEAVPKVGGTAWPFFQFPIPTAGKTGTAEIGDPNHLTHAWYTAYAPVNKPQISITALIEKGGEGSTDAAPVVKEILRYYFSPDKANLIKDLNVVASQSSTQSARTLGE